MNRDGRTLKTELELFNMVKQRGTTALGPIDGQTGRLVNDKRFGVFEKDGDIDGICSGEGWRSAAAQTRI